MALIDNIVSYYKLDENAANTDVEDIHGANEGTASTNTANLYDANGKINSAFDFVATSSDSVNLNFVPTTDTAFSWTIWFKTTQSTGWLMSSASTNTNGVDLLLSGGKLGAFSGGGGTARWLGTNTSISALTSSTYNDGNWHFIVLSFDGTNGAMYVDDMVTPVLSSVWTPYASIGNLWLAVRTINFTSYYDELLDEIGIWSVELSSDNRGNLYNSGNGLAYPFAVGTNMKINISDVWKDIDSLKINIGDAWKNVIKIQQNIGDVWKTVFG